jgi:Predicted deacetylase
MASKFLLCFHDFSVWNYRKVAPILEELRDLAGAPFSVLVIPDTEKASPEAVQGFRETLLQLKNEGFELALHGYKHRAEFSQGPQLQWGLIGMNLTHGEAEFAGLSEYESSRLLQAGLDAWHKLSSERTMEPWTIRLPLFLRPGTVTLTCYRKFMQPKCCTKTAGRLPL